MVWSELASLSVIGREREVEVDGWGTVCVIDFGGGGSGGVGGDRISDGMSSRKFAN